VTIISWEPLSSWIYSIEIFYTLLNKCQHTLSLTDKSIEDSLADSCVDDFTSLSTILNEASIKYQSQVFGDIKNYNNVHIYMNVSVCVRVCGVCVYMCAYILYIHSCMIAHVVYMLSFNGNDLFVCSAHIDIFDPKISTQE
jgi:hypothetical protein